MLVIACRPQPKVPTQCAPRLDCSRQDFKRHCTRPRFSPFFVCKTLPWGRPTATEVGLWLRAIDTRQLMFLELRSRLRWLCFKFRSSEGQSVAFWLQLWYLFSVSRLCKHLSEGQYCCPQRRSLDKGHRFGASPIVLQDFKNISRCMSDSCSTECSTGWAPFETH